MSTAPGTAAGYGSSETHYESVAGGGDGAFDVEAALCAHPLHVRCLLCQLVT
jgi:hypothetical protein